MRRFNHMLSSVGITFQQSVLFKSDAKLKIDAEDIDFLTLNLQANDAISVKCDIGVTAIKAINQLKYYMQTNRQSFWNQLENLNINTKSIHFLGLSFPYENSGKLVDWIQIPCI